MTTRPPLSPVASNSPSELNSTQEIMSAETGKGLSLIALTQLNMYGTIWHLSQISLCPG